MVTPKTTPTYKVGDHSGEQTVREVEPTKADRGDDQLDEPGVRRLRRVVGVGSTKDHRLGGEDDGHRGCSAAGVRGPARAGAGCGVAGEPVVQQQPARDWNRSEETLLRRRRGRAWCPTKCQSVSQPPNIVSHTANLNPLAAIAAGTSPEVERRNNEAEQGGRAGTTRARMG